ncbi:MAG: hypothetical protein HYR60_28750 [Acidobacteria bacterium]|nr:hypothetical protein [Acidobacteriota bacterium]
MEEAWDLSRQERREPLWRVALERSHLFRIVRARLDPNKRKLVPTADDPFAGTNAVPPGRVISDRNFAVNQITAYLSNWQKLVELAAAYHYQPVCILSPAAGLDPDFALPRMMSAFRLDRQTALQWMHAFEILYQEAGRQIENLRAAHPDLIFLNLTGLLKPPQQYYWDLGHVYDEANTVLAERIYGEIAPLIDASLRSLEERR